MTENLTSKPWCNHWFTIIHPTAEVAYHATALKAMPCPWCEIALLRRAADEPRDGFTDALAQELYGKDPAAVGCAMMHADDIEGDSTDALALRVLAEEVRRLRAAPPPTDAYGRRQSPHGYAYRYHDIGGDVLRFNHGEQVNGGKPFECVPYWIGEPETKKACQHDLLKPDTTCGVINDHHAICSVCGTEFMTVAAVETSDPICPNCKQPAFVIYTCEGVTRCSGCAESEEGSRG